MEAAMFIMINMYGYVCAYMYLCMHTCVHVHAYVYKCVADTTHPHLHPPPTCQGGNPPKTV